MAGTWGSVDGGLAENSRGEKREEHQPASTKNVAEAITRKACGGRAACGYPEGGVGAAKYMCRCACVWRGGHSCLPRLRAHLGGKAGVRAGDQQVHLRLGPPHKGHAGAVGLARLLRSKQPARTHVTHTTTTTGFRGWGTQ